MKRRRTAQRAFVNFRAPITLLVCAIGTCSIISGTLPAFFRSEAPKNNSQRTLSFAERVAYQRAIEHVYWRHRIWPKARPDPKPRLDALMSPTQLEKKVTDYLRESQALEDYWQRPLTAEQLQAEMDRMAQHTRQPEVLRELFEALGNDPFVIAECLARPALAERLLRNWYARDQRIHGELRKRAEADLSAHLAVEQMKQTSGKYREIELVRSDSSRENANRGAERGVKLNSHQWEQTVKVLAATFYNRGAASHTSEPIPIGVLSALQEEESSYYATAVIAKNDDHLKLGTIAWHKETLESWLARAEKQPAMTVTPGVSYSLPKISDTADSCVGDTWTAMPGPPDERVDHASVWTGSEMIIWGGQGYLNVQGNLNTGGRYNPSTDSWMPTSNTNAPAARYLHTAIWTGTEMIVWGGFNFSSDFNTGGRYNPTADSWTPTSTSNAPAGRTSHTAVWTGSQMIVWGGNSSSGYLNTGGRYNPNTDSWTATSTTNAPAGRSFHTAVWTGSEMIAWGGLNSSSEFNTGGRYNPVTDNWTATSTTNAPGSRSLHTAVWTGSEMIVWGPGSSGGKYNPMTDSWTATSLTKAPSPRSGHSAVWTGSEMIVWGGDGGGPYLNTGGRYDPGTDSWVATSTNNAADGRIGHTAVWTGSEMLVWGGITEQSPPFSDDGGRYDPATDSWIPISSGNAPLARFQHTAIWTGTEMIVWGGQVGYRSYLNTGGRYVPSIDNWSATSTTDAPSARDLHTAIWTGTEMIVWGGNELGSHLNIGARNKAQSAPTTPTPTPTPTISATGGRYDPSTDTWRATSTTNAPSVRESHTAVWTGTKVIVWGGSWPIFNGREFFNSGGQYDPITDSWSGTGSSGAPDPRDSHTAVWTGTELIVWGGYRDPSYLNTGGRYNPVTSIWTPTGQTNVPAARRSNTAVWTGNEMIIWGGYDGTSYLNTGGRYNPSIDGWTATNTVDVPAGRIGHTAVWNDSDMIIWGGQASTDPPTINFNNGGRYNPTTDSWTATSLTGAPAARSLHTGIWTGNEMIIWGGELVGGQITHTGTRYCGQSAPSPTPTTTPTLTPRPSPTPRPALTPRPRPTPPPRP